MQKSMRLQTLLLASSPRICSRATHPSSSIKSIQSFRISRLQETPFRPLSNEPTDWTTYLKSLSNRPICSRWNPSSLWRCHSQYVRVRKSCIPVEPSREEASAWGSCQQSLWLCQFRPARILFGLIIPGVVGGRLSRLVVLVPFI